MIKGYKYRLDPTSEQIVQMEKTFGCCRYVYNWALDLKIKTYQSEKRSMSAVDLCKQLTLLKKDDDRLWLNEVSVVNRVGDVESLALAGTLKRQNILV